MFHECTIRVTVLLEYLDRTFSICGYLLFYNLLILDPILLFFEKDCLVCLVHLHSNFQLVPPCCLCDIEENSLIFYLCKIDFAILPRLG